MTDSPRVWLDALSGRLWRGERASTLRPKTFAVLRYLLTRPNQIVTSAEIRAAVWPEVVVTPGVLKNCILELRTALADPVHAPQYIATVPRRGYRLLKPILAFTQPNLPPLSVRKREHQEQSYRTRRLDSSPPSVHTHQLGPFSAASLVGREAEISQLSGWLAMAISGERQIVFVTGEAGVGKTAVIEAFLQQAATQPGLWTAHGQCIEHYGVGEAYLPMLEALGRLGQELGRERLIAVLRQQAPTWLAELPGLLSPFDREQLQRELQGVARERMLRELSEAIDTLTSETPLLLVLEDLHWSDPSMVDLLFALARRRLPGRFMLVGTYRPAEVLSRDHPLKRVKQELEAHEHCQELALAPLDEVAVAAYLARRFSGSDLPDALIEAVYKRTEGNPFFLGKVLDEIVTRKIITFTGEGWDIQDGFAASISKIIPAGVEQLIEKQFGRLSREERQLLEVASIAGLEFSAATVAVVLGQDESQIEELSEGLARRVRFIQARSQNIIRDRRRITRYKFLHSLCRDVIYSQVVAGRRARFHQKIGLWLEAAVGGRTSKYAAELALHFERGLDYQRAIRYREQAARTALRRHADAEATNHFISALELLKTLPDGGGHPQRELALQTALGTQLIITKGYAAPEVAHAYMRARELSQRIEGAPQLFPILLGLSTYHLARAEYETALTLAKQLEYLAHRQQKAILFRKAHLALSIPLLCRGSFTAAQAHIEQATASADSSSHRFSPYRQDFEISCRAYAALLLWIRGYSERAEYRAQEALTLAQKRQDPFDTALALHCSMLIHQWNRKDEAVQNTAKAVIDISQEYGFPFWHAGGIIVRGTVLNNQAPNDGNLEHILQGIAAYQSTGAAFGRTYWFALLAQAYGKARQVAKGLTILTEALTIAHQTEERWWEAELLRLKGELLLQSHLGELKEAEQCFQQAGDLARRQEGKALELRAAMSLSRLWQQQGKRKHARQLLTPVYSWFTEGFDTTDLQEARALLQEIM